MKQTKPDLSYHYANPIPRDPFLRVLDYLITLRLPASPEKTHRIKMIEAAR